MTTPTPQENLDRRLQILESQLAGTRRSLRRVQGAMALVAVAGVGLLVAATADLATIDLLQTKRLEIISDDGHVVLAATSDAGGGRVDLWTPDGCNVMRMAANKKGGDLALWNCSGRSVAGLFATDTGGEVSIWDNDGGQAARLHHGETGGSLELLHASQTRAVLAAAHGGSHLKLMDALGHNHLEAAAHDTAGHLSLGEHLILRGGQDGGALNMTGVTGEPAVSLASGAEATLTLAGPHGHVSLATGHEEVMPAITIRNGEGHSVAAMAVRDHGGGSVSASAPGGGQVASIRSDKAGNGRVDLSDQSGTIMATMQTRAQRGATLALMAPNEKTVCAMAASEDGGVLNLSNGQGVPVVVGGIASSRRDGAISVFNQRGIPVVSAGSTIGGIGQLDLNDDNGHRLLSLPQRHASPEDPTIE